MTISSRVGPFAQVAAAIRRAFVCCFPCCFRASNTEDIPVTNTGDIERRPSHTESAGGAEGESPVLSQLSAYTNDGFEEAEEDTHSLGQSSDLAMSSSSQASSPTASRVSTPEPLQVEPLIVPQVATLLGTGAGTETSSQSADDTDISSAEEEDTSSQSQSSEPISAVIQEPSTSAATTPTPAPRKPMGQARTPSPPPPPVRSGSLSPKSSAEVTLPPPEPKENRLFSVRSRPKIPGEGASGSGFRVQQQTIFAVTTDQKIIRKRKDQGEPARPMGAVMKAKVELGFEKERKLLPAKPSPRGDVKDKIALFEPKPAKGEAADDSKSGARSSGQGKKSA